MNCYKPYFDFPNKVWVERFRSIFEIILLSGSVSSLLAGIPFYLFRANSAESLMNDSIVVAGFILLEAGICFLLLALVLTIHREKLSDLGLCWKEWKPNLIVGLALIPLLFLSNAAVSFIFQLYLPQYYVERNPLTEIIHTPQQLALFIFSVLIAGGIKEELQRAFILTRFRQHLGGAKLGLVLWSAVFGAGHYIQGVQGVIIATVFGFAFGAVYLIRGNLIAPIIAHGIYDTSALLMYWFFQSN